jgi:hypothetical protein
MRKTAPIIFSECHSVGTVYQKRKAVLTFVAGR